MQTSKLLLIAAAFLLPMIQGCFLEVRKESYPQYSGTYKLVSSVLVSEGRRTNSDKLPNGAPFPKILKITHRMIWAGHYWQHHLGFAADELGTFKAELANLMGYENVVQSTGQADLPGADFLPHKDPVTSNGTTTSSENIATFCTFYGYDYKVYIGYGSITPDPKLLKKIYYEKTYTSAGSGASVPGGPAGTVPEKINPNEPPIDHGEAAKWYMELAKRPAEITISVGKLRNASYSGCNDVDTVTGKSISIFPLSDRDKDLAEILLTYRMSIDDVDDSVDLRDAGKADLDSFLTSNRGNLFDRITGFQ